ncbi:uncharacterized protein LOC120351927 isoform X1 [Nilaparvata lugens]|uniref:uncharacterized protein LOC120351927 isoform X1 n=1 Tax=Nilaparvata lugens TaxID=108931 RepID=UPI00193E4899|nr:uncharacterized protein LOC120351927 isoform X1 [Nilaparvata lugens]
MLSELSESRTFNDMSEFMRKVFRRYHICFILLGYKRKTSKSNSLFDILVDIYCLSINVCFAVLFFIFGCHHFIACYSMLTSTETAIWFSMHWLTYDFSLGIYYFMTIFQNIIMRRTFDNICDCLEKCYMFERCYKTDTGIELVMLKRSVIPLITVYTFLIYVVEIAIMNIINHFGSHKLGWSVTLQYFIYFYILFLKSITDDMWYTYYTGLANAGEQLMRDFEGDLCLTNFHKDLTIYKTLWRKLSQLMNGFSNVMDLCYALTLTADLNILFLNLYTIYDVFESSFFSQEKEQIADYEPEEIVDFVGLTCFIGLSVIRFYIITSSAHGAMKQVRDNTKRKLLNLISEIQISNPGKEQQVKKFLAKVSNTPVSIRLSGFEVNNSLFITIILQWIYYTSVLKQFQSSTPTIPYNSTCHYGDHLFNKQ